MSTAIASRNPGTGGREVEAPPWFETWFSIDPQPASISPTINISIVFICAFLVDCGRTIHDPATKNDSSDGKRFVVRADEILTAFLELQRAIHEFAVSLVL